MTGHTVTWTHGPLGTVEGKFACHEGRNATCHIAAVCDCDTYTIETDKHGAYHISEHGHRHAMLAYDKCRILARIDKLDADVAEMYDGVKESSVRDGEIVFVQDDNAIGWQYADDQNPPCEEYVLPKTTVAWFGEIIMTAPASAS